MADTSSAFSGCQSEPARSKELEVADSLHVRGCHGWLSASTTWRRPSCHATWPEHGQSMVEAFEMDFISEQQGEATYDDDHQRGEEAQGVLGIREEATSPDKEG